MSLALGLLELDSIAFGVLGGDAMVKRAPVEMVYAGTVHPGKYLVLVGGDVASVEEALDAGRAAAAGAVVDEIFLPDPHPQVTQAIGGVRRRGQGESLGIVETRTVAATLGAADRGVKGARVELRDLHLADDLGGKAYCTFRGVLSEVEAAVDAATAGLSRPDHLVARVVIPQLDPEMLENLDGAAEFLRRLRF